MSESRRELLRKQFDLTWSLLDLHLEQLQPADFLWEPAANCWTLHRDADGTWVPDWAEQEPEPIPVPTLGWISWHIGWWWTVTIEHARGRTPPEWSEVGWPGAGNPAIEWLRNLRVAWLDVLDGLTESDLDAAAPFPWQDDPDRSVADMIGWVNVELMKNAAEIGQLRLLRAAG